MSDQLALHQPSVRQSDAQPANPYPGPTEACGALPAPGSSDGFPLDLDDLPDGLIAADAHGQIQVFNRAAGRITGIDPHTAVGMPLEQTLPFEDVEGRDWWQLTDPFRGLKIRTGQPEACLMLPNGRDALVTVRYVRQRTSVHHIVIGLRSTQERLRVRQHADLLATVAHELRSPLTSIKGFTATLLAKWERFTDDQRKLLIENVNGDADRVTRLTGELIDVAQIDSGRLRITRQNVDVETLIRAQIDSMIAAGQPTEQFTVTARTPCVAMADPDKLRQALANLLENAARYSNHRIAINITTLSQDASTLAVTIDDDGPGIPQHLLGRVFSRFWRGNRQGGTGLGLHITKGIIEAHGGTITADRSPLGGARFYFTLPTANRHN